MPVSPKPEKAVGADKLDLSVLADIEDRVTRSLAKKEATQASRAGKSGQELVDHVKSALEQSGKLTLEVAEVVTRLAATAEAEPAPTPTAANSEKQESAAQVEISILVSLTMNHPPPLFESLRRKTPYPSTSSPSLLLKMQGFWQRALFLQPFSALKKQDPWTCPIDLCRAHPSLHHI